MTEEKKSSFEEAAKPLIKWLAENVNPHHQAVVTSTDAELLSTECFIKNDSFVKD